MEDNKQACQPWPQPDYEMYDSVLAEFSKYMRKELEANFDKGDRNGEYGWLNTTDNKYWISEIYYHTGKLQEAIRIDDIDKIKEYCADIANLSMMLLDVKINLLKSQK